MGTRYTKNIPKSVYFWKSGGYWAGPFVHPQKGRPCVEYNLVPVTPIKKGLTQKELDDLRDWLQSDEGKQTMKEALEKADETCKIIDSMRDIDPKKLREPFNI
jgi:hypothetical protein